MVKILFKFDPTFRLQKRTDLCTLLQGGLAKTYRFMYTFARGVVKIVEPLAKTYIKTPVCGNGILSQSIDIISRGEFYMTISNNLFIPIYHKFFTEYKLNSYELYTYSHLFVRQSYFTKSFLTNIMLLSNDLFLTKRERQNKELVKNTLLSLFQKKIIYPDIKSEEIESLNKIEVCFKQIEGGYQQVEYQLFNLCNNADEYTILCCVLRLSNKKIPLKVFTDILECSTSKVSRVISSMEKSGLLKVDRKRKEDNTQEPNVYEINTGLTKSLKNNKKKRESKFDDQNKYIPDENGVVWGNWGVYGNKIEKYDYYLYLTQKDEYKKLKEACEKRIEIMKKSGFDFTSYKKWAEEKIAHEKEMKRQMDNIQPPDDNYDLTQAYKEQKEKKQQNGEDKRVDISKFSNDEDDDIYDEENDDDIYEKDICEDKDDNNDDLPF